MEETVLWRFVLAAAITGLVAVICVGSAISQNILVNEKNLQFEFTTCTVRTITLVEQPVFQNVSDVLTQQSCYYYKHLPNEFILGPKAVVQPELIAAAVLFSLFFVAIAAVIYIKNK